MDARQKKALTAFSLIMVLAGAVYFTWVASAVIRGVANGGVWPGKFLMLLIADWNSVTGAFKGLGSLIVIGLAYLGTYKVKDWLFYAIVVSAGIGFLATAYLFFELTAVSTATEFWAYSPTDELQDYQSFVMAARVGMGFFTVWFLGILATELGMRQLH